MKTITLKQAYEMANDQSVEVDLIKRSEATNSLYHHAYKVLPEVVAELDKAIRAIKSEWPDDQWHEIGVTRMEEVINKVNRVGIP